MNNVTGIGNQWGGRNPLNSLNQGNKLIKNKDTNGDKTLNAEELGVKEEVFSKIDTNEDGQADIKELNKFFHFEKINNKITNIIESKDENGDGLLNAEELGISEELFSKIDHDEDGQVDRTEIYAAIRNWNINRHTNPLIHEKDTNGDKVLTAEELGVDEELFSKIDTNEDGQADGKELNVFKLSLTYNSHAIEEGTESDVDITA